MRDPMWGLYAILFQMNMGGKEPNNMLFEATLIYFAMQL